MQFSSCFVYEDTLATDDDLIRVLSCTLTIRSIFWPLSLLGSVWIFILIIFPCVFCCFVRALLETLCEHDFNGYAKLLIFSRISHLRSRFACVFSCKMAELAGWLAGKLVGWRAGWLAGWRCSLTSWLAGWLAGCLPACLAGWLASWRRECSMCTCFSIGFIRLIEMLPVCLWGCLQRM